MFDVNAHLAFADVSLDSLSNPLHPIGAFQDGSVWKRGANMHWQDWETALSGGSCAGLECG